MEIEVELVSGAGDAHLMIKPRLIEMASLSCFDSKCLDVEVTCGPDE